MHNPGTKGCPPRAERKRTTTDWWGGECGEQGYSPEASSSKPPCLQKVLLPQGHPRNSYSLLFRRWFASGQGWRLSPLGCLQRMFTANELKTFPFQLCIRQKLPVTWRQLGVRWLKMLVVCGKPQAIITARSQRLRDGKMLKSSVFILMKQQLQTDQGRARGEHFQHLTRKWVHSVLGTNLCQHPVFLCLSHI